MEDFLEAAERILEDLPRLCNEEDFSSGLLQAEVLFIDIATFFIQDEQTFDQYGIDWKGPVPLDSDTDEVVVPSVPCPLNDYELQSLRVLY